MSPSSTRSDSIDSAAADLDLDENTFSRIFNIYKPAFRRHYEIKSTDEQPLYYVNISASPKKPDLVLHDGNSDSAPKIAACKFLKLSGHGKLALGDPDDVTNTQWEDMIKQSSIHLKYRFEMTIPGVEGRGERRAFVWKRTHSIMVKDTKPFPLSMRSLKMIDERTGRVAAVFTRERSLSKCGKLQIRVEYGEEFDRMVLMSGLSAYHAVSGGGGGGG